MRPEMSTQSEKRTGNVAKRRLLVNPYRPEIQTEFRKFYRGKRPELRNQKRDQQLKHVAAGAVGILAGISLKR